MDEVDPARVTIENNYVVDSVPDDTNVQAGTFYPPDSILKALDFTKIPWDSIGLMSN